MTPGVAPVSRARRGIFLALLLLLAPVAADPQPAGKIPRVGILWAYSPSVASSLGDAFRESLRGLGYVEGRTIVLEERWAEGRFDRLPSLAAELVRLNLDVIVTASTTFFAVYAAIDHKARSRKSGPRLITQLITSGGENPPGPALYLTGASSG